MNRLPDYDDQIIRATPYETLFDYRATVFPECLRAGPEPAFSMEHPEVWVTARSLKLFLKYYENPSKRMWLKRPLNHIEEDEVRAYRAYVLPPRFQQSPFFSVVNASTWVSMDHFYAFLTTLPSLEQKRGRLPNYTAPPPSPTSPTSPASDHTFVNPPTLSRTRSHSRVRTETETVERVRVRRNSYAKERPSVHTTPKKPTYQIRRRASVSVPRPPVFSRPQIEANRDDRRSYSTLMSSSISEASSSSSACSGSTITSLPSEYKSSRTSPLTHLQLLGRPAAAAMIIRRPRTSGAQPDVYEVYPDVEGWLETYLSSAKRYYDHIPFSRFYSRHQKCYAVPVESTWAKKHIGRVESPVKKPRSGKSSRVALEEPISFPHEYQADLFDDEETLNGFMAIARAASRERGINEYRW